MVTEIHNIMVTSEWFIAVDGDGYCTNTCLEGAFGIVIQLKSITTPGKDSLALKIPRLLADTPRENAYICQIVNNELITATSIFKDTSIDFTGLLYALSSGNDPLRKPITGLDSSDNKEISAQNNQLIAIQFKKDRTPRFIAMKSNSSNKDQKVNLYPTIQDDILGSLKNSDYDTIREKSKGSGGYWQNPVVIRKGNGTEEPVCCMNDFFKNNNMEHVWYICMPSVMYAWGVKTLQELLSTNDKTISGWDTQQRFRLIENILTGLISLHKREYIHADLRPANIIHTGTGEDPDSYYIIDYAGFIDPVVHSAVPQPITGHTVLGPSIGADRITPFYAPERRLGRERESANTALIVPVEEGKKINIFLTWSGKLFEDKKNNMIKEGILESVRTHKFEDDNSQPDTETLISGDRIQLREHIYAIDRISKLNNSLILQCDGRRWKIYHGKIVVVDDEKVNENSFPVPKYTELQKWSIATDIFSVGALLLYVLYVGGSQNEDSASVDKAENTASVDEGFSIMMKHVENMPRNESIWRGTSYVNNEIMACYNDFRIHKLLPLLNHTIQDGRDSVLLYKKIQEQVITLIDIHPGLEKILAGLKYNGVHFMLCLFYAFRCIHRKISLPKKIQATIVADCMPFCESRNISITSSSSTLNAKNALTLLMEICHSPFSNNISELIIDKKLLKEDPKQLTDVELLSKNKDLTKSLELSNKFDSILRPGIKEIYGSAQLIKKSNMIFYISRDVKALIAKIEEIDDDLDKHNYFTN